MMLRVCLNAVSCLSPVNSSTEPRAKSSAHVWLSTTLTEPKEKIPNDSDNQIPTQKHINEPDAILPQ